MRHRFIHTPPGGGGGGVWRGFTVSCVTLEEVGPVKVALSPRQCVYDVKNTILSRHDLVVLS